MQPQHKQLYMYTTHINKNSKHSPGKGSEDTMNAELALIPNYHVTFTP